MVIHVILPCDLRSWTRGFIQIVLIQKVHNRSERSNYVFGHTH